VPGFFFTSQATHSNAALRMHTFARGEKKSAVASNNYFQLFTAAVAAVSAFCREFV
jgi:hypothetical protein